MLCWITDITGSIAELRKQVIMSVTKTVFRVCMTFKKVPENFAGTTDFSFLLRIVFFGSSLLVIFLKFFECKITLRKEILLCALCHNMEYVVMSLTLNSFPGFLLLFFFCLFFWSDVIFFQLRLHASWFQCEGNPDFCIRPVSSEYSQTLGKDLCTPLAFYLSCHHPFVVLKPYLFGISCLTSCVQHTVTVVCIWYF